MIHRFCLAFGLSAAFWSALLTPGWAGPTRTATGRVVPYGEKEKYAGVPDILSPEIEFTFDTAGGAISGSFQGESRKLHRDMDDLLVCVCGAAGTFRATFQPEKSGQLSGKAVFSTWQVTVYQMDGKTGTLDTSQWTADWLRRVEYHKSPGEAAFYGTLVLESGKGSGAISADKHFFVEWDVTFQPLSGERPAAPPANTADTPPTPAPPQVLREFYVTRLTADKEQYATGEPVELTVELERWAEVRQNDGSVASLCQEKVDACSFDLVFSFHTRPGRPAIGRTTGAGEQAELPQAVCSRCAGRVYDPGLAALVSRRKTNTTRPTRRPTAAMRRCGQRSRSAASN